MTLIKRLLRELTPPLIWRGLKKAASLGSRPEWEFVSETWPARSPDPRIMGWNVDDILKAYQAKWPAFVESLHGPRPFGLAAEAIKLDVIDVDYHNTIMCFAYVLARAAQHQDSLSMLDWGGGIGHYYLTSQALMPGLAINYHCKDVPILAEHGQRLFPEQHFYADETCLSHAYDLVLASGSLHYSQDWAATLCGLAKATAGYLFVTRLPVALRGPSYVFVQRPYRYGYNTEYMGWCVKRDALIEQAAACGLRLEREFVTGEQPPIHRAPDPCHFRGFLFQPERRPANPTNPVA